MATPDKPGRRSPYPATALLAALASARAAGSLAQALKKLHEDPLLWERCRASYRGASKGVELPPVPPRREQLRYFRDRLLDKPEPLVNLKARFMRLAVGQVRLQGNMISGVQPNGADPDERHTIYGDGVIIKPFSEVREVVHPRTGEKVVLGSRGKPEAELTRKSRPRLQTWISDTEEDGKQARGLNMVAIHTWTSAGRVVLGTGSAMAAEQWAVLDLVDSIHDIAGDGIHTLIYDRAITGWCVDYLMGARRIQVLSKAVAKGGRNDASAPIPRLDSQVARTVAEFPHYAGAAKDASYLLRRDALSDMVRYNERLPVGMSIYPTTRRNYDQVRSDVVDLEPAVHDTDDGPCVHELVVDDGGLFLVEQHPEESYRVKTWFISCIRSTPFERPDGLWGTRNEYMIPCASGDFAYVRDWLPDGVRFTPADTEKEKASTDRVGWRLRPLCRADDIADWYNGSGSFETGRRRFSERFSRRNDAESFNQWYEAGLLHHGRAATLSQRSQELDFLLAALLNNSITWRRHRA